MADLIDRQELISWLSKDPLFPQVESFGLTSAIESRPSVDAEPVRHGHWKWMGETGDSRYMCSVCKSKEDVPTCNGEPTVWEYCPNCGAKMDESIMGQENPSDKEFTLYADEKPIVTFKDSKTVLHGEMREDE